LSATFSANGLNKQTDEIGGGKRGPGRPPGSPNKINKALKDMILGALDKAGGEDYLTAQAKNNPNAFLALIGKVLPTTITGPEGKALVLELRAAWLERVAKNRGWVSTATSQEGRS
jgi:hypothetical protein